MLGIVQFFVSILSKFYDITKSVFFKFEPSPLPFEKKKIGREGHLSFLFADFHFGTEQARARSNEHPTQKKYTMICEELYLPHMRFAMV